MNLNSSGSSTKAIAAFDLSPQPGERYVLGLDIAKSRDYSALCAVRRLNRSGELPVYQLGQMERLPRMSYDHLIKHVSNRIVGSPRFHGKHTLVIDATG